MKPEKKERLKSILATFDENGLVALSNKGLVRRAQKDLESATLLLEETDDNFIIKGDGWTVWMPPEGPLKARDDTPATGITRQILSATIYLRAHFLGSNTPVTTDNTTPIESTLNESKPTESKPNESKPNESKPNVETTSEPNVGSRSSALESESSPRSERLWTAGGSPAPESTIAEPPAPTYELATSIKSSLQSISPEDLAKWSGKTAYKEVRNQLGLPLEYESTPAALILRFPLHEVEVRFLSHEKSITKLLDSALSTAPKAMHKRWVVAAILELQRQSGKSISAPIQQLTQVDLNSQREVLSHCKQLLEDIVAVGLAHPSTRMVERLYTTSMSASSFYLPRLAFLLRSLAAELSRLVNHDVKGETQRLLDSMSWAYALACAIESANDPRANTELAGVARTQYDPAGDLSLFGVAAYPWRSDTGYSGLTLLFWEQATKRFLSWSISRPSNQTLGFFAEALYTGESPWVGSASADVLCRSSFVLKNARMNPIGRLSSSQQSGTKDEARNINSDRIDFAERLFNDWTKLHEYAAEQFPCGLRLKNPMDRFVVLQPKQWGERYFDEMQQSLCWQITDETGRSAMLTLPWNNINEKAIEFLESVKPEREKITKVVARIVFTSSGYRLEPISLIGTGTPKGHNLLNPCFDQRLIEYKQSQLLAQLRKKHGSDRIPTAMNSEEDWEEMTQSNAMSEQAPSTVRFCLSELEHILLFLSESGTRTIHDNIRKQAKVISDKLSRAGLLELASASEGIALESQTYASTILWTNYLCKLHWQLLSKN